MRRRHRRVRRGRTSSTRPQTPPCRRAAEAALVDAPGRGRTGRRARRDDRPTRLEPMITVHHLNHSRSHRVLWLLEELGLDYELRRYERDPETLRAPPALRDVHPSARRPRLSRRDERSPNRGPSSSRWSTAMAVAASPRAGDARARALHVLDALRRGFRDARARPSVDLLPDAAPADAGPCPPVVRALAENVIDTFVQPQIDQHLDYMDAELAKATWFAGDEFTAADIQMSFPDRGRGRRAHPGRGSPEPLGLCAVAFARARPYRRALDKGGPYDLSKLV